LSSRAFAPDDVIVVRVFEPEDDATRQVFFAGDGFELHCRNPVLDVLVCLRRPTKRRFAGLLQDIRPRRRAVVCDNFPFGRALAGDAGIPAFRESVGLIERDFGLRHTITCLHKQQCDDDNPFHRLKKSSRREKQCY
jgi:hypothetical protein